jgi:hypothetical protein
MSKKVSLVTNSKVACGIHGYALSALSVLEGSTDYQYKLVKVPSNQTADFYAEFLNNQPSDIILLNHCTWTMPWLTGNVLDGLKKPVFMMTGHDHVYQAVSQIKHIFVVDPTFENTTTHSALPRPITMYPDIANAPIDGPFRVGTFGFGQHTKRMEHIVIMLNEQIKDMPVEFHMQIGEGDYINDSKDDDIIDECQRIAHDNVTIHPHKGFIHSRQDLANWLNQNHINVFVYKDQPNRSAVSSCLDVALSACRPIAIRRSSMFKHAQHVTDIVLGKNNTIRDIYNKGTEPLEALRNAWTPSAYRAVIENKFKELL